MAEKFPNADLVACGQRETAMRKGVYLKKEGVTEVDQLSPKLKGEYEMMQAITEQLTALPKLLTRYKAAKEVLRDILPQPYTFDIPHEGVLVLVYCYNSDRPYLATRAGLNKWLFEDNKDDIVMNGLDSQQVYAFSYLPSKPALPAAGQ
jgi:hypothetical protein